jgi:DNA-binding response OmpR family regulator
MKILAVEDDASVLAVTKKRLEIAGYEVITAIEGLDGLKKARSENPDLIILDLILPNLNGYQICSMLKRDNKYQNIPIIMLTSRSKEKDVDEGFTAGADAYITKPYDAEALLFNIRTLLGQLQLPMKNPEPQAPAPEEKPKEPEKPNWWEPEEK